MTDHLPNDELRVLLAEADWSGERLAREVNKLGSEAGVSLAYDRTSVAHWLAGTRPRAPASALIAEAFTRRLGRQVTARDAGVGKWQPPRSQQPRPHYAGTELARLYDARPQSVNHTAPLVRGYRLTDLAVPAWAHEMSAGTWPVHTDVVIDRAVVEAAESMASVFSASDAAFGGGSSREALAAYLAQDLAVRLTSPARPVIHRRLCRIAARLAYLCGFMCFDDELNGLAQAYYLTALWLAAEAGDQVMYAITLREMSVQARLLGHHRQAVQLAEAAVATGPGASQGQQAFLCGQLAVACAADGDRFNALASLTAAERHLDRATSTVLVGAYHPASLAHQQATVRLLLGDRTGAIAALAMSLRHRPPAERRSRAITLARRAELQFRQGHLDEATASWHEFLDEYPQLSSGRADTALKDMRSLLRPHARQRTARALLNRAVYSPATSPAT